MPVRTLTLPLACFGPTLSPTIPERHLPLWQTIPVSGPPGIWPIKRHK